MTVGSWTYNCLCNRCLLLLTIWVRIPLMARVSVRVMVLNATFNNISVISWQSVVLMDEIAVLGENHRPVASHKIRKSKKDKKHNGQKKKDKRTHLSTIHYITNYGSSNTNPTKSRGCTPEGLAVPVPLVPPVVLMLNDTNIIRHGHLIGHQYTNRYH